MSYIWYIWRGEARRGGSPCGWWRTFIATSSFLNEIQLNILQQDHVSLNMMTSSNGNIFRVTGHLCGEFTGQSPVNSPRKGQQRRDLIFSLICSWINGWVNNREAGDLRRHRVHYDVIVMKDPRVSSGVFYVRFKSGRYPATRHWYAICDNGIW